MTDYKNTVFLPKTDFPMKAGLPAQEPKWLDLWRDIDLYGRLQQQNANNKAFTLHDGPPYANGDIHVGHALNKILKDAVMRSRAMMGLRTPYVPGWDCHGLPIEWKVEEKYRKAGKNKDAVPVLDFRAECRAYAQEWVNIQSEQFQRLGVTGDWANPYLTMTFDAEAAIAAEIHKFATNGSLYRAARPVMWSTVEKTALAEAEVEYHDVKSMTLEIAFPVVSTKCDALNGASIVIWTTTPWTIPANRAIAYGDFTYRIIQAQTVTDTSTVKVGTKFVVGASLVEQFTTLAGIAGYGDFGTVTPADLEGTICAHPLRGQGYDFEVPLFEAEFVTLDSGTGFVHIAPSHGADDYQLGIKHGIEVPELVLADGQYADSVPLFAGQYVYRPDGKPGGAGKAVTAALLEAGALVASREITHSYPHSWRSKAPVIFRATPQWFISMETTELRATALAAIDATEWTPRTGYNRIRSMVEGRPDWCISRQRAWGVPIAIFVNKQTREVLRDQAVFARIREAFQADGADAWYKRPAQEFLGNAYKADDYEQINDIVDVWFESGSTHAFVCEARPELTWPADLYLEGSDQHRGWFQASLLESCGTRGRAPFNSVLTHGFTLDEQGRKMSKSVGNVIAPEQVIKDYGADILRLWALSSNYQEDNKIGPEILKQTAEQYRKLRNTLRYVLGGLDGLEDSEKLEFSQLPELERYVLHLTSSLDEKLRAALAAYDFTTYVTALQQFCTGDLSAFYFDVRKDALYCDTTGSLRRRACRTVMAILYDCLTAWLAPVLCFTAEEAWQQRGRTDAVPSVHMRVFPTLPTAWRDDALDARWNVVRDVRRTITGALELARAEKKIGSALQAAPTVYVNEDMATKLVGINLAEVSITSSLVLLEGNAPQDAFTLPDVAHVAVVVTLAEGAKCERCWQVLPEVGTHAAHPLLCDRCHDFITKTEQAAA